MVGEGLVAHENAWREMEVFGGGRILETRPDAGGMTTPHCFGFVTDLQI